MLKVRIFVNEPNGKTWSHFLSMIPGLEKRKELDIAVISKPRDEYQTEGYLKTGLPPAPAIMVDDEVVVQGKDMAEEAIGAVISWKLDRPSNG